MPLRILAGASCWLIFYGFIGCLALMVVLHFVQKYADREELRHARAMMDEQIKAIKAGEMDCLVHPDPLFIDNILADMDCERISTTFI